MVGDLKIHTNIHTEPIRITCVRCECGKNFNQTGHLKKNKQVHRGETPYACNQCEKSLAQACNLKTHKLVHTG